MPAVHSNSTESPTALVRPDARQSSFVAHRRLDLVQQLGIGPELEAQIGALVHEGGGARYLAVGVHARQAHVLALTR